MVEFKDISVKGLKIKKWVPYFNLEIVHGHKIIYLRNCSLNLRLFSILIKIEKIYTHTSEDTDYKSNSTNNLKSDFLEISKKIKKIFGYLKKLNSYKLISGIYINEINIGDISVDNFSIDKLKSYITFKTEKVQYVYNSDEICLDKIHTTIAKSPKAIFDINIFVKKIALNVKRISKVPLALRMKSEAYIDLTLNGYDLKSFNSTLDLNGFVFDFISEYRQVPIKHLIAKLQLSGFENKRIQHFFPELNKLKLSEEKFLFQNATVDSILNAETLSHVSTLKIIKPDQHFKNKNLIATIEKNIASFSENYVCLEQVSEVFLKILILSEDPTFFSHNGIDIRNVINSLFLNLNQRMLKKGASTITMQLARNLFLDHDKNFNRKIEESLIAMYLELYIFDKSKLLEMYVNIIEFAPNNVRGIYDASLLYFNKKCSDLSIKESILLCYIIPRPKYFLDALENKSPQLLYNFTKFKNRILLNFSPNQISEIFSFEIKGYIIDTALGKIYKKRNDSI